MGKAAAIAAIILTAMLIVFSTWMLFRGNIEASFSTLPVLVCLYLLIYSRKKQ